MKSSCIKKQSSTHRMQITSCSLLETSATSSAMIVKNVAFWMQIFAASCQEPLPLAAHSEPLVMCISHLFLEATQWSLDFLEPVDSAADVNWSSPQTLFKCSSLLLMAKPAGAKYRMLDRIESKIFQFLLFSNACRSDSKSPISPITVAGAVTYLATASISESDDSGFWNP